MPPRDTCVKTRSPVAGTVLGTVMETLELGLVLHGSGPGWYLYLALFNASWSIWLSLKEHCLVWPPRSCSAMSPTLQGVVSSLKPWARNELPSFEHASVRDLVTATRKVTDATRKSQLENTATGYLSVWGCLAYKMTMQNPLVMSVYSGTWVKGSPSCFFFPSHWSSILDTGPVFPVRHGSRPCSQLSIRRGRVQF